MLKALLQRAGLGLAALAALAAAVFIGLVAVGFALFAGLQTATPSWAAALLTSLVFGTVVFGLLWFTSRGRPGVQSRQVNPDSALSLQLVAVLINLAGGLLRRRKLARQASAPPAARGRHRRP